MSFNVPDFESKFLWLCVRAGRRGNKIALELGVNPAQLTRWKKQNRIPYWHVQKFCDIFGIDPETLEAEIKDFKDMVKATS